MQSFFLFFLHNGAHILDGVFEVPSRCTRDHGVNASMHVGSGAASPKAMCSLYSQYVLNEYLNATVKNGQSINVGTSSATHRMMHTLVASDTSFPACAPLAREVRPWQPVPLYRGAPHRDSYDLSHCIMSASSKADTTSGPHQATYLGDGVLAGS